MKNTVVFGGLILLLGSGPGLRAEMTRNPQAYKVAAKQPDIAEPLSPAEVQLEGWLGKRVANNEKNRLLQVDLQPLLAGYRKRPGSHPWIGEHIGKWLHAATLAWSNTGDEALRKKIEGAAKALIATQEPDGYLGTYLPDKRFGLYPENDWDVWSHKYCLLGLLTYYQYSGDQEALNACRKVGDLLIRTFGPGKKSILSAGTHVGMAATSVLEPVVLLYRHTGDNRYLDFAKYVVSAWDEPNGPQVLATLTTLKAVNKTANGKAYEMLSNLVGLCELARATGEKKYFTPAVNAWADVAANQLYLTGTASYGEHFHGDHDLPNQPGANIGETCVTVTWIQLTSQLLRLTGDPKYGQELERSYYNHLAAAQRPDGAEWCYYTALEGAKPYGPGINCCVSSGPRGMAMAPTMAYFRSRIEDENRANRQDALLVNLFEPSQATLTLGGQAVTVTQKTAFPRGTTSELTFALEKPAVFGLKVRVPAWAEGFSVTSSNPATEKALRAGQWMIIPASRWKNGDTLQILFPFSVRYVKGEYTNQGKVALLWGPMALAYDEGKNPGMPPASTLTFQEMKERAFLPTLTHNEAEMEFRVKVQTGPNTEVRNALFVPFAEAGSKGSRYRVWLGAPGTTPPTLSLLSTGKESRNAEGNVSGSILDGDLESFAVTYDGKAHTEDWFAATLEKPVAIRRIVYAHGKAFHDGGWFDTSAGKPRIEVQRTPGGLWEKVGILDDYPMTTAADSRGIRSGQTFTLMLKEPITVVALRIIGKPAHGDRSEQSFASCAELQAFEK